MNKLDAELMLESLRGAGYSLTHDSDEAGVILYNTCSIREHAEDRVYSRLGALRRRKERDPEKVTVEAEVEQPNGPLIAVQFRMQLNESGWMVYDVVVEGVSLVATHRSSFSNIIRDKGIDGLITMLEEKNIGGKSRETPATSATPATPQ